MKLLFVNPASVENLAMYDYNIISNLRNTDVIYLGNEKCDFKDDYRNNVRFISVFSYDKYNSSFMKGLSYVISFIKLIYYTVRIRPQVVHVQWPKVLRIDNMYLYLLNVMGIPVVHTAHNVLPHDDLEEKTFSLYKEYYNKISTIIVHTEATKEEIVDKFGIKENAVFVSKIGLMPIIYDKKKAEALMVELNEKNNLNQKIVFASLGFQSFYKGLDFIVEYWLNHSKELKNSHLFIAGYCRYDRIYELNGRDDVTIIDKLLSYDEYMAVSLLTSVILIPYIKISQSGVLMSAMSDEIPVLISNVGGLPEPLQIADVGWNMGEPNYENFEKMMNFILNHPEEIEKKKNNQEGWNKIKDAYDWKNIAKKTEEVYFAILNHK